MSESKHNSCGCHLDPVNDKCEANDLCSEATDMNNGVGWKIVFCPTHTAASELLSAINRAIVAIPGINSHGQYYADAIVADLKHTIAKIPQQVDLGGP